MRGEMPFRHFTADCSPTFLFNYVCVEYGFHVVDLRGSDLENVSLSKRLLQEKKSQRGRCQKLDSILELVSYLYQIAAISVINLQISIMHEVIKKLIRVIFSVILS